MARVLFKELGFPIVLVDPPMVSVRGHRVPDVNMRALQETVFRLLVTKPARLTGAEVRFVRKRLGLTQADLAGVLNMANHSVVSQWEAREDSPTGMEYNTEVLLRVWMAAKAGEPEKIAGLVDGGLRDLKPVARKPMAVTLERGA
jgi:DNA-binding transcriptional regulator YiaG